MSVHSSYVFPASEAISPFQIQTNQIDIHITYYCGSYLK